MEYGENDDHLLELEVPYFLPKPFVYLGGCNALHLPGISCQTTQLAPVCRLNSPGI